MESASILVNRITRDSRDCGEPVSRKTNGVGGGNFGQTDGCEIFGVSVSGLYVSRRATSIAAKRVVKLAPAAGRKYRFLVEWTAIGARSINKFRGSIEKFDSRAGQTRGNKKNNRVNDATRSRASPLGENAEASLITGRALHALPCHFFPVARGG